MARSMAQHSCLDRTSAYNFDFAPELRRRVHSMVTTSVVLGLFESPRRAQHRQLTPRQCYSNQGAGAVREEACSGIGSLYALLAVAVLLLIQNRRSFFVSLLSLATVPIWAIMGNFIRLLAIAVGQEYFGRDLSHGTDHELLGLVTFAIAGVCFWLTEYFLSAMLYPVPASEPEFATVFQAYNHVLIWPQQIRWARRFRKMPSNVTNTWPPRPR